jgi:FlaA1/EpsC-like NDP-sugar epimerase
VLSASRKHFLPYILLAVAIAAGIGAFSELRTQSYYPFIKIRAPDAVEIDFLFVGSRQRADCETIAGTVVNSILSVCPTCSIQTRICLDKLSPEQKSILSSEPLAIPSARMVNGSVTTYRSFNASAALSACKESERQSALRGNTGRVLCYPPLVARPTSSTQEQPLDLKRLLLGLFYLMVGGFAFCLGAYLIGRYEDLQNYLSSLPRKAKRLLMLGMDMSLIPTALVVALALEHGERWHEIDGLELSLALALLIAIPVFVKFGLYSAVIRYMEFRMTLALVASVTVMGLLFAGLLHILGITSVLLQDIVIFCLVALLLIGGSRVIAREYLRQARAESAPRERIVVYGAGSAGVQLAISLKTNQTLLPVAFIDDKRDLAGSSLYGIPIYPSSRLPMLVKDQGVQQVLLAIPSASRHRKREIYDRIEPLGVRVRTIPRLSALLEGKARISDIEDISIEELVGRDLVPPLPPLLSRCIENKTVLVTGAGGSIGAELCRQIIALSPRKLFLLESSEYALYSIHEELLNIARKYSFATTIVPILGSVTTARLLEHVLAEHEVNTIYHAAAYKHVPLLESNPLEGIRNNVLGSLNAAEAAIARGVDTFVLVSTDKAVRPANIMGASKRMAELIMQAIDDRGRTRFCMVRFGNVLDSSGSVVPLFRQQIRDGGPVTVTHPDITRYFMTIPEAAQLVLQAGAMAEGGDVFVLDMGSPVKILDLARRMIGLSGHTVRDENHPDGDIEIRFSGLRPGEKLYEELLIDGNKVSKTEHPLIMRAMEASLPWPALRKLLTSIEAACNRLDQEEAVALLTSAVAISRTEDPQRAATSAPLSIRSTPLQLVN